MRKEITSRAFITLFGLIFLYFSILFAYVSLKNYLKITSQEELVIGNTIDH